MNKYTELSDFEVNKKVALNIGGFALSLTVIDEPYKSGSNIKAFDPCNNPSDAMPIIIENEISMIKSSGGWMCCHGSVGNVEHESLYRGAMEVFLMMKDEENNND